MTTEQAGPAVNDPTRQSIVPPDDGAGRPDIAIFSPLGRNGGSAHGGITRVVLNLAQAFAESGRTVELVTFAPGDPVDGLVGLRPGISCFNFPPGGRLGHLFRLRSYVDARKPRVLLSAGQRPNLLAARCKRLFAPDARVFLSVHNALTPALRELGPIRRRLRILTIRRTYPSADGIVCVSEGVAQDLARLSGIPRERLTVIHNPVLTPESLRSRRPAPLHPWLAPGEPPVILGAGRLTRQKDFATLVRAFEIVTAKRNCRLMILGEGGERDRLERLAGELGVGEQVLLPGFVDDPIGFMGQAALFVLSSAWEGFGNVLVEAMAAGTPVVSTDCPSGPREILLDGKLGPLVPVGDPRALARAMIDMLSSPTASERLRTRAADFLNDRAAELYLNRMLGAGTAGSLG